MPAERMPPSVYRASCAAPTRGCEPERESNLETERPRSSDDALCERACGIRGGPMSSLLVRRPLARMSDIFLENWRRCSALPRSAQLDWRDRLESAALTGRLSRIEPVSRRDPPWDPRRLTRSQSAVTETDPGRMPSCECAAGEPLMEVGVPTPTGGGRRVGEARMGVGSEAWDPVEAPIANDLSAATVDSTSLCRMSEYVLRLDGGGGIAAVDGEARRSLGGRKRNRATEKPSNRRCTSFAAATLEIDTPCERPPHETDTPCARPYEDLCAGERSSDHRCCRSGLTST